MEVRFIKMQSCGMDYILLDTLKHGSPGEKSLPGLAAQITNRRFGVGGEGLVLLLPGASGNKTSLRTICLGSDGDEREPCPMGIRCLGRYVFDSGLAPGERIAFETSRGNKKVVEIIDSRNVVTESGPPLCWDQSRELKERTETGYIQTLSVEGKDYNYLPVYLNQLIAVFFSSDYESREADFIQKIRSSMQSLSVSLAQVRVISREELSVQVWERGERESLCSENGACAALVASVLNGFADREAQVHLKGGNLLIQWSEDDNHLYATGSVDYVFTGTYYYEEEEDHDD